MNENEKNSIDISLDFCKQQLIFAGILISATVALFPQYSKDFQPYALVATIAGWSFLLLSVLFGLIFFGYVTHRTIEKECGILPHRASRIYSTLQIACLLFGTLSMFVTVGGPLVENLDNTGQLHGGDHE